MLLKTLGVRSALNVELNFRHKSHRQLGMPLDSWIQLIGKQILVNLAMESMKNT